MTDRELMQQALGYMESVGQMDMHPEEWAIAVALQERLAQPEQEPVAWLIWLHGPAGHFDHKQFAETEFERRNKEYPDPDRKLLPLYTTPPRREWVGLTDEEIAVICGECAASAHRTDDISYARAIEAKLKEKNNG